MIERRTAFSVGFKRAPWSPSLGQFDWSSLITGLVTGGVSAYGQYQAAERAEEQRKTAEARAAAAQAAADAARAEAEIAEEESERRQARAEEVSREVQATEGILGIPTGYFLLGGAALAAVAVVFAIVK